MTPGAASDQSPSVSAKSSFDELYVAARPDLYRALATITGDRDLATETIDAAFTGWRRKLRKPRTAAPAVGVMALAMRRARRRLEKEPERRSGFRLSSEGPAQDTALLEVFRGLSLDERGLLVMGQVLGWDGDAIGHALGADGAGAAAGALLDRLERQGFAEDRIAVFLRAEAATYSVPLARLESVKAKGLVQRAGILAGGAALVAVGALGAAAAFGGAAASPSGVSEAAVSAAEPRLTAENAVWEKVPLPAGSGDIATVAHDGTDYFLLAQNHNGQPVLMQSADGRTWAQLPAPPLANEMGFFQHIVATPDLLLIVGNGFDERRGRESTLAYVSQDRVSWQRIDLPGDDAVEAGGRVLETHAWVAGVTANDAGYTIIAHQGAEVDPEGLLAGIVDPDLMRHGYGTDNDGIHFYDNQGNLIESMTWEELDLDPDLVALLAGNRMLTWTSSDGLEWKSVEMQGPPGVAGVNMVAATETLEAALAFQRFGASVWLRTGDEWQRPDLDATVHAMAVWGDRLIVAGTDRDGGSAGVWTTTDGVEWDRLAVETSINQFHTSTAGIVGLGWDGGDANLGPATLEVGDLTVLAHSDGRLEVQDAAGSSLVEVYEEGVARGAEITVTDPETGDVVVTFDDLELERAWEEVYRSAGAGGRTPQDVEIAMTVDGRTWETISSGEPGFFPNSVAVGGNSLLLSGWAERGGLLGIGGGGPQLILVHPG